jgi:hypothetical protein
MHCIFMLNIICHMIGGGGGIFISEVNVRAFVKLTEFHFVNALIGRVWVSIGVISLSYNYSGWDLGGCDYEALIMRRPWPTKCCCAIEKKMI